MNENNNSTAAKGTTIKQSFDIEHEFNLYLERMGLAVKAMPSIQYKMLKEAFYGAISQYLVWFQNDAYHLPEELAIEEVEKTFQQCNRFWNNQKKKVN